MQLIVAENAILVRGSAAEVRAWLSGQARPGVSVRRWLRHWLTVSVGSEHPDETHPHQKDAGQ